MTFKYVIEHKRILPYLLSRQLLLQYKKAKSLILCGDLKSVDFKKRKPYKSEKYYFRINKQYRAIGYIKGQTLIIFEIDDHQ